MRDLTLTIVFLAMLSMVMAASLLADDVWTGGRPFQATSAFVSESVDPSSTETSSSIHRSAPGASVKSIYYSVTGSGGSPAVSIYVVPSLDCTTYLPTSTNVSVAYVTSDGTGMVVVGEPYRYAPCHKVVVENHSSTVTATCDVIMGGN